MSRFHKPVCSQNRDCHRASRGVDRPTTLRLAEAGASVVVNYPSNDAEAFETVRLCEAKGTAAVALAADVSEFLGAQAVG